VEEGNLANVRKFLSADLINHVSRNKEDALQMPLHIAAERGHFDVVYFLVENGVDVDMLDERLCTACIKAVVNDNHQIALLLASHGADIRHKDMFGRSAFGSYTDVHKAEELRIARTAFEHRET
jgi:ankyrin repeat protein